MSEQPTDYKITEYNDDPTNWWVWESATGHNLAQCRSREDAERLIEALRCLDERENSRYVPNSQF